MILYPAIDIKAGEVVRLEEGRLDRATVYAADPAEVARAWGEAGFSWLHVVDLDGAVSGAPVNAGAVARILEVSRVPVQLGGGVRDLGRLAYWIDAGVTRIVIGTAAVRDPAFVKEAAREYPERIVVAIDARDGKVAVEGWVEQTDCDAIDLARRFEDAGVAAIMVTDIARDGRGTGLNIEMTGRVADAVTVPVIASGGLWRLEEIAALKARPGRAIHGAIIGRALYEHALAPQDVIAAAAA